MKKYETTLPKSAMNQVVFDALHEPYEVCNWDKRRKCDSYYIEMYVKQKKQVEKAVELLKWVKDTKDELNTYNLGEKDYIDSLLEMLGDSNE